MRVLRPLLVALLVASPLAFVASPAGAQVPIEITGNADCNDDGTYTLFWEIENFVGFELDIDSAELDGAATGSVTSSPNPIPVDGVANGSFDVPGDTAGFVLLIVEVSAPKFSFDDEFEIELLGDCEAIVIPTTTTTTAAPTTTTTAPAARPLTLTPAFTG
jgi:hypothetical protein